MVKLLHSGDLGDVISALPTLQALGGGTIILTEKVTVPPPPIPPPPAPNMRWRTPPDWPRPRGPRQTMRGRRFDAIAPLLRAQPYVHEVVWMDEPKGFTHDLSAFRVGAIHGETISNWQARYLGVTLPDSYVDGWLTVPNVKPNGLTVVARSPRYHNYFFPWEELLKFYPQAVFVGEEVEYNALRLEAKRKQLRWHPTHDLLELAELIAGAERVICNQSCPFWIAAGLGVPLIQETCEEHPNSIIKRANAIYTASGPETRTLIFRLFPPSLQRAQLATLNQSD